ncbi:hypothetical protein GCK72_002831 [Caenorhabditis remanei]|uniref:Uncharacterized protein n=1 Tax=Caenorhabditis remanei TaxID=31234 RepID=A0A6A5HX39_CAERE|nr:hypothetical protein GCK72_002827 [Caenorhabditis remanei]XP_053592281.1 hypothetical protein GCK72_002831 [Caenorhabditis remanei]KAF1771003.1 hypothetical protein GCK72_002827 [Caenorhabditis remanei]KAF1771007.1 hypothetical protein GCK72_002831 [Caenorhabditis remanei]
MIPGSLNIPVRRKEEKGRRKQGKSQCRRGTQKPKAVSNPVLTTSKSPSPASTPSQPAPPAVVIASVPVITNPLLQNLHKDPTQSSPNLSKEGKHTTRKKKNEKVEKDPPKTTIRKKKKDLQSISIDLKTSSENDGPGGSANDPRKKKSHTSSDSKKKRSSNETKSDGSKEPSDNEEKTAKKFNPEMANNFFKFLKESHRARRRTEDAHLERMPESSQLNYSVRSIRSKLKKGGPKTSSTEITNFFKPNGDPIWVVDSQPTTEVMRDANGVAITNKELVEALAEDNLELDEKSWYDLIESYIQCKMSSGTQLPEDHQFDSLAPADTLTEINEYQSQEAVSYNTVKNLVELSEDAIQRYEKRRQGDDNNRPARTIDVTTVEEGPVAPVKVENFQLNTCIVSNITFDLKKNMNIKYDRHNAIASIRKLHRKMSMSMEKTAKGGSNEKN